MCKMSSCLHVCTVGKENMADAALRLYHSFIQTQRETSLAQHVARVSILTLTLRRETVIKKAHSQHSWR